MTPKTAVAFAYHDVGVRGLAALLEQDMNVRLLVTHEDNPEENIWFESAAEFARLNNIPVITPEDPNSREVVAQVAECQPDWLFSFYFRHMLCEQLLLIPTRGAYNMHGSLLPAYRGRVPINWAVLNGERETGATLHQMIAKPDAGPIIDQQAVPILANDTAQDVFRKVTYAAETVLLRSLPLMLRGQAEARLIYLSEGSYYGGRRAEDGRINWRKGAEEIHNLIRAVAPPYPGAFFDLDEIRIQVLGSYYRAETARMNTTRLYWDDGYCYADCADGRRLCLTYVAVSDTKLDEAKFNVLFGNSLELRS